MAKKNKAAEAAPATSGDVTEVEVISTEPQKEAAPIVKTGAELLAEVKANIPMDYDNLWKVKVGMKQYGRKPGFVLSQVESLLDLTFKGDFDNAAKKLREEINEDPRNSEWYGHFPSFAYIADLIYSAYAVGTITREDMFFCMSKTPVPNAENLVNKKAALENIKSEIAALEKNIEAWETEILAEDNTHAKECIIARKEIKIKDQIFWKLREDIAAEVELLKETKPTYFQGSNLAYSAILHLYFLKGIVADARRAGQEGIAKFYENMISSKIFMERKSDGKSVDHARE